MEWLLYEKGAIRPRDMRAHEFSPNWLVLCRLEVTKVAPGVYGKPRRLMDSIAIQATKYPRLVLSMTTALWLHGILERPVNDRWLIGPRARVPGWYGPNARFHRSRWVDAGVGEMAVQSAPVRVHSPLWAALNCVRFRRAIGLTVARDAVERTIASGRVLRGELFEAARQCHLAGPLAELLAGQRPALATATDSARGPSPEPQLRNGVEMGNPQPMKFTVRTQDGELTFGSFGEVEKAWLLGLVGPEDELLEEGKSKWRKASSYPYLVNARRTGEQAWGGAWFLWTVIGILMGSGALYELKTGIAALSHGEMTPDIVFGAVLGLLTAMVMIRVTVKAHKNARPHG
jgi:hypothetical protein